MKFNIEDVTVYFPYEYIYPEQHEYMRYLKQSLDVSGHCLLEMPTGTGKTIALLSFITSYQLVRPALGKLIYCTRTVPEMEKVLKELKHLMQYRKRYFPEDTAPDLLAVGLSSRSNLCIHPAVYGQGSRDVVDAKCRQRTAPWKETERSKRGLPQIPDIEDLDACVYYEQYTQAENSDDFSIPANVYTLTDLRRFGEERGWCPYFLARRVIAYANVVVFNYQYMIDPKVAETVAHNLDDRCVIVFDEAHNIDNIAIEALSVFLHKQSLLAAKQNIRSLFKKIKESKGEAAERLRQEHQRLVDGLVAEGTIDQSNQVTSANPIPAGDALKEAVPGNIRRAEHFVSFLNRFVGYLWTRLDVDVVQAEGPDSFVRRIPPDVNITRHALRFCHDRLYSLINTLEIDNTDDYLPIRLVSDLATLVGTYHEGFQIIIEPYDERTPHIPEPILQLACLDASIAMKPVFTRYRSVIITSGTLSPLEFLPKILDFRPVVAKRLSMTLTRECLCPVVVRSGADQLPISTEINMRYEETVIRNYGRLLVDLCQTIPDGIVCFFVSYEYMKRIAEKWHVMKIMDEISQHKLPFFETQDVVKTTNALANYRLACNCGRGGIFFSIARGKVAEGIDFDGHYGRILLARLSYLNQRFGISNKDYLNIDALRQAAQCMGRVIRDKSDYGMMVLADKRYGRMDKMMKLPAWIRDYLRDSHLNLSTDMMLCIAKMFMMKMAQPTSRQEQSLLTETQVRQKGQTIDEMDIDS